MDNNYNFQTHIFLSPKKIILQLVMKILEKKFKERKNINNLDNKIKLNF